MAEKIIIKSHDDHVDQRTAQLRYLRRKRGEFKTTAGYMVPKTTYADIAQMLAYWDGEFKNSRAAKDWYKDADKRQWLQHRKAIAADLEDADPDAVYARNEFFWNRAILKLAILLQVAKTRPSPTQMFIEAVKETVVERVQDADQAIEKAGKVAENVAEAGDRAWSTLKIAGIVAASVAGAAILLPPIIRAVRD